jgi:hypothetical protein
LIESVHFYSLFFSFPRLLTRFIRFIIPLPQVTKRNTSLLNQVALLTNTKMQVSMELNKPAPVVNQPTKLDAFRENEELNRIKAYVQFQAKELGALRTELNMLKRKEAPPLFSATMPAPPAAPMQGGSQSQQHESFLPPIHKK